MSLQRLKAALGTAEFTPHTLALGSDLDFVTALSRPAHGFIASVWPKQVSVGELLLAAPWSADVVDRYRALEPDERMEVLAFVGFHNHEQVHRLDFLTTPFGVAFQGRACLETIGLLLESAELVAELERSDQHQPLRDIPPLANSHIVSDGVDALNARVRWFDSMRGAAPIHIQTGWMSSPGSMKVGAWELDLVMVHELMPTFATPGGDGTYVRPLTVLESRAVALTGLLLLHRLGGEDYAAAEVARFLETFYTPREAFPDYRFLLDLFAELSQSEDLASLVEQQGAAGLATTLKAISAIGWYGLHSSPEANSNQANSSPMLRVVFALQGLMEQIQQGKTTIEAVPLFDAIDAGERARELGLTTSRETLAYSIRYLRKVRQHNQETNPHADLRAHFEWVLSVQQGQLERRLERGYDFAAGMPEDGSVLGGIEGTAEDAELLFGGAAPPDSVPRWFRLREMLLFRYARPPGFWPELWDVFGTHPGATHPSTDSARNLALMRSRFVADGTWPIGSVFKQASNGDPTLLIPIRTSTLPETYRRAAAEETDTIETTWDVLPTSGDPLVALVVKFVGAGEEVRILFSMGRHREQLEAISQGRYLALFSDAAFTALHRDEPHPETVWLRVEDPSRLMALTLSEPDFAEYEQGWLATTPITGEETIAWAVEACAWPNEAVARTAFEALGKEPPEPPVKLSPAIHPDDGEVRLLIATGAPDDVRRLREERLSSSGTTVHRLSEAAARSATSKLRWQLVAAISGSSPYEPKPRPVRLS